MKRLRSLMSTPRLPALGLSALLAASLLSAPAFATPTKLGTLPVTLEPGSKLFVLSDAGIQKAFPSGNRPDAVFVSKDSKVSLSFEWRTTKLAATDLNTMLTQFPAVIRAQVPGIKSLKQQTVTLNGDQWADFVFVAPGKAGDVRRELLITSAQGRMLVLTISSTLADYGKNEADVQALTNSLKIN